MGEFSLVDAKVVDLLVMEPRGADELVRPELVEECWPQARIRGELAIFREPLRKRAGTDDEAKAFLDLGSHALARLAAIEAHKSLKDDRQGKSFAFGCLRGEDAIAVMAAPELDSFEPLIALAFPGDAGAAAVEATLGVRANEGLTLWRQAG